MSDTDTFLLGVASGLVSAVLLYICRYIIGAVFSGLAGIFNRSIRGTWQTKFMKGSEQFEEIAKVRQLFHMVWGTIEYPNKGRKYSFKGTISSNVLIALYEICGNKYSTIDRGAFTLSVNPTGEPTKMVGRYSWTDDDSDTPRGDEYEWNKK